jgi:hypothetical protein
MLYLFFMWSTAMSNEQYDNAASLPLFPLGRVVATPGALALLDRARIDAAELLYRHSRGDWGDVPSEDAAKNARSLLSGDRILSSYPVTADSLIWIITEADRSVTTLLLPDEY